MRFLHSAGRWSRLSGRLGGELLTWRLSASGFASSLLCTSHWGFSERESILREIRVYELDKCEDLMNLGVVFKGGVGAGYLKF